MEYNFTSTDQVDAAVLHHTSSSPGGGVHSSVASISRKEVETSQVETEGTSTAEGANLPADVLSSQSRDIDVANAAVKWTTGTEAAAPSMTGKLQTFSEEGMQVARRETVHTCVMTKPAGI